MTQEYEFFKDFAGVTKADLEMFKCGGKKMKVKKGEAGVKTEKKRVQSKSTSKVVKQIDDDQEKQYVIDRGKGFVPDTTKVTNNPAIGKNSYEIKTNGRWSPIDKSRITKGRQNPRPKRK